MGRVNESVIEAHEHGLHDRKPLIVCGLCYPTPSPGRPATVPPSDVVAPIGELDRHSTRLDSEIQFDKTIRDDQYGWLRITSIESGTKRTIEIGPLMEADLRAALDAPVVPDLSKRYKPHHVFGERTFD